MTTIYTRASKGSALSWTEGDANITNLNNDKIESVVEDTSPQLGGNLDVNGNDIVGTTVNIRGGANPATAYTSISLTENQIRLFPGTESMNGTILIGDLYWPANDGTNGQVIKSDGAGNLGWTSIAPEARTSISVSSTTASGGGSLSYDNTSGVLTFSPAVPGITEVVQDTTPQLGGDLDVNGKKIANSVTNGNILLETNGTGKIQIGNDLDVNGKKITNSVTNGNLVLEANGTGRVQLASELDVNGKIITTSVTNGHTDLRANGTGRVRVLNNIFESVNFQLQSVTANNFIPVHKHYEIHNGTENRGSEYFRARAGNTALLLDDGIYLQQVTAQNSTGVNLVWSMRTYARTPVAGFTPGSTTIRVQNSNGTLLRVAGWESDIAAFMVNELAPWRTLSNLILRSNSNGNIELIPNGTGRVVFSNVVNASGNISLTSGNPLTASSNITLSPTGGITLSPYSEGALTLDGLIWPTADGTSGQVLTTNGTGTLSWTTVSGGITDVVQDTTPQLGGDLDVNGKTITSASNGNIVIAPNGTGKTVVNNINYNEAPYSLGTTSGTITPNVANGNVQTITLNGNLTFSAFSSPVAGQSLTLIINTGGTGRTLTSTMKFSGGEKTISTTNTTDILSVFYDGTNYWASLSKDFK